MKRARPTRASRALNCFFMCFFPLPNLDIEGPAYRSGLHEFECGYCPECLQKRSSRVSLLCTAESYLHVHNCMITLTYDNYERDSFGRLTGRELPPDRDLHVCVRDIQLFIKRLRKWYSSKSSDPIKYYCGAEYGSHTHRAHYHLILFGVDFFDKVPYKKSKRGNPIYTSSILTRLWSHGICTIDSVNVTGAIAAYCSKYAGKTRDSDTFSLCSHHLGLPYLLSHFNGRSYFIDGREHPVPRSVWESYIMSTYSGTTCSFSPKYVNKTEASLLDGSYYASCYARRRYREIRDTDILYRDYLAYWSNKISPLLQTRPSVFSRIVSLPAKFNAYKSRALQTLALRQNGLPYAPVSGTPASSLHIRYVSSLYLKLFGHLPYCSCHNTANDTKLSHDDFLAIRFGLVKTPLVSPPVFDGFISKNFDNSLDIQLSLW